MNIQGLDKAAIVLNYTPIALNAFGEWDTPRSWSRFFNLSFLFPFRYEAGEMELQEGESLQQATAIAKSCQAFDGAGVVIAIARAKREDRRREKPCPWGKQPPPENKITSVEEQGERLLATAARLTK